jgi:hypothetical protein
MTLYLPIRTKVLHVPIPLGANYSSQLALLLVRAAMHANEHDRKQKEKEQRFYYCT